MTTMLSLADIPALAEKAEKLVAGAETCLLSTLDAEGYPVTRALLAPRFRKGLIHMEFTTNTSSMHVAEARGNAKGSIYYYDAQLFQGLLLKGTLTVSTEQADRDRIWRQGDEIYYGGGQSDPDYAVMLFSATRGRWYENFMKTDFMVLESDTHDIF